MVAFKLDLNCDLGEGEHPNRTRALMRLIRSANIACGGHAGDERSMSRCVKLAHRYGVNLGAHPGPPDRNDFGRGTIRPTATELISWILEQAGRLQDIAKQHSLQLHHIKLHGALYHASESDQELAQAYAETIHRHFPGVMIYSRSGGLVAHLARQAGIAVKEELFADRGYLPNGELVPRTQPGALLAKPSQVTARLAHWLQTGKMETVDGGRLPLNAQTICVHGDTPGATALIRAIHTRCLSLNPT